MNEIVIFIWIVLAAILGFVMLYVLKKQKRALGKMMMVFLVVMIFAALLVSLATYWIFHPSINLIWLNRLNMLLLGGVTTWALFYRPWTIRHKTLYKADSLLPELLFIGSAGCVTSVIYTLAPQFIQLVSLDEDLSIRLWDLPLLFFVPLVWMKTGDLAGQVPFKTVENPFIFTIEDEDIRNWPRRDLMQVNFRLKTSLEDEFNLFTWDSKPWIEAPKEVALGKVFRLMIQQRRQRKDLDTIQDMGDEYNGTPGFWWAFKVKFQLLRPTTWKKSTLYLNPDLSLKQNGIASGDLIVAQRLPGDGKKVQLDYSGVDDDDFGKTVIINR